MTEVTAQQNDNVDDPHIDTTESQTSLRDLIDDEVGNFGAGLETGDELGRGADEDEALQGAPPVDQLTSPNGETGDQSGKRPGIDTVLNDIEREFGSDHANVVRGLQTQYGTMSAEWKQAQMDLREAMLDVQQMRNESGQGQQAQQQTKEPAIDPDLKRVSPQQWQMFDKMAAARGLVYKEDLEAEQLQEDQADYLDDDIDKGVSDFGEDFGQRDESGKFVINPNVRDKIQETHARLFDGERGPTVQDLYKLSEFDKSVEQKAQQKIDEARNGASGGGRQMRTGGARRSSGAQSSPRIYKRGESLDNVIARAAQLAYREIP